MFRLCDCMLQHIYWIIRHAEWLCLQHSTNRLQRATGVTCRKTLYDCGCFRYGLPVMRVKGTLCVWKQRKK